MVICTVTKSQRGRELHCSSSHGHLGVAPKISSVLKQMKHTVADRSKKTAVQGIISLNKLFVYVALMLKVMYHRAAPHICDNDGINFHMT